MRIKGLSLLELVVAIIVMAALVAGFQPMVMSYVEQSRQRQTESQLLSIVHAFRLHRRDTSHYPIYSNARDAEADLSIAAELLSQGTLPLVGADGWEFGTAGDLEALLNTNSFDLPTTLVPGLLSYQGPYLDQVGPDPWGQAYIVTAIHLERVAAAPAFVISAGANGVLETERNQTGDPIPGGDDILQRLD